MCTGSCSALNFLVSGSTIKRAESEPANTDELSEYATNVPSLLSLCVLRIMPNKELGCSWPSITQSALKIL